MSSWPGAPWLTLWGVAGLLIGDGAFAEYRGRPVTQVLDELRGEGLTFIYSSQLVPRNLRVEQEPAASSGVELAREILSPHGLSLSAVVQRVYAVVADPSVAKPAVKQESPARSRPEEVVVQTSRYTLTAPDVAAHIFLTQEELKNIPRLADETLRSIDRLPGSASNGFSSLASVRGGTPGETAIILNGLRLYEPFHLKNFLSPVSVLDSRVIAGMEFYSGGFPAIYGDRMSAIVDASTIQPSQPRYYELGLNVFHTSALAALQFDDERGRLLVSARRSNVGDLAQYADNDFGKPDYGDGFARLEYRLSGATRVAFNTLLSDDGVRATNAAKTQSASAEYNNVYAWGTLDHDWSDAASSRLIASYTDLSNEREASVEELGRRAGGVIDERDFRILGLRLENQVTGATLDHRFGIEGRYLTGRYDYRSQMRFEPDYPFPGSPARELQRVLSPAPHGYETSAYWDVRAMLSRRWMLQAGMRVDNQTYDGSDDGEQWSPRLSVMYTLGARTRVRASWGRFFQSQGVNELQVEDGIERFYPVQRADHAIVGLDHSFDAGVDLRLELYRKYYRDIHPRFENLFDPLVLFPEAEFDRVLIDARSARARGVELLVRLRPHGSWSGWFSYAWSRAEDRVAGTDVLRSWDQTHAINIGISWSRGPWSATVANSYHTGWPTTALADSSARNSERFDFYNTLDARLTRTFALSRGALDVFVEVTNALSRNNPCCVQYEVRRDADGSLRYSQAMDSWLPTVPSLGVLWRY
ncbi:TonB-dependent receptor plug domain-containing protein [Steroidobacter flavus]|uniref:TonB-dependent receptor plug domain-containing protein n=1 Tax=Steroidobacter flavus TaxID=1842136 RepID=A0ABV8SN97_9GAMM